MAGKAKFDQEAAFKSIIGAGREPETESSERQTAAKGKNKDRVQRSYFLDRVNLAYEVARSIREALDKEKNLTETINELLRIGLDEYLK